MRRFALVLAFFVCAPSAVWAREKPTDFQRAAARFMGKCGKCHTVGRGDRVGPDLKGVTRRHDREWLVGFVSRPSAYLDSDPAAQELLKKYNGVRMDDLGLARSEVEKYLDYIKAASEGPAGPAEPEPLEPEDPYGRLRMPDEGMSVSLPGMFVLIILLVAAGGLWQLGAVKPASLLLVPALAVGYWSLGGRRYHHLMGNQQGFSPVQPIAFSHARHAGALRIACLYCHHGAEKSDVAGVPAVSICMNCHGVVRKAAKGGETSGEIAKILAAWNTREDAAPKSIEWVRVHDLADYVHFSHKSHVLNDIRCQECHGPVQTMARMRQAASLSMGWCVNCHRLGPGRAPTHWRRSSGPLDCTACHR